MGRITDALVVTPAYNEAKVIEATLSALFEKVERALVVDDGSSDETSRRAAAAGAETLRLATNLNYGGALQTGFLYAVKKTDLPYIMTFDADGQHDPSYLEAMLEPLRTGKADYVIGSRYLEGSPRGVPAARDLGIRLFAAAASAVVGQRITDPTSGLLAMTREVAQVLCSDFFPQDYPDADVVILLSRMGFRIMEVPVRMKPSPTGKSMHSGVTRPLFYVAKMSLAMIHAAARPDPRQKRKEAKIAA